ncbi:RusA family crossover junction endodeoxyribonuclease, partial [Enterobacter cloacae]|uniref:RusA family crossover junction endodeoxyribonuclease n=1 Tax=Enterobacter cloacae TaxID=550 RepID=UPI002877182A
CKKTRAAMDGQPQQQKPDLDNLPKALLDALFEDDAPIWDARASKIWGETGMIMIEYIGEKNA